MITKTSADAELPVASHYYSMHTGKENDDDRRAGEDLHHRPVVCFCPEFFFFHPPFLLFARALFPSNNGQRPEPSVVVFPRQVEKGRAREVRACRRLRPHTGDPTVHGRRYKTTNAPRAYALVHMRLSLICIGLY